MKTKTYLMIGSTIILLTTACVGAINNNEISNNTGETENNAIVEPTLPSPETNTPPPPTTIQPTLIAANPLPGSPGLGDILFPEMGNGGYDVEHYLIELYIDLENDYLEGAVTITAVAVQDLSSFNLELDGLEIHSILVDGNEAEYQRDEKELIITPTWPIATQARFKVMINYSGVPITSNSEEGFVDGWQNYGDGIFIAGEPAGASSWYPVNEHPLDKASYTFYITVDKPLVVAANGSLIDQVEEDGRITYHLEEDDPMASYLVTMGIGDFDVIGETTPSGVKIRNYFGEGVPNYVRRDFRSQGEMIEYFSTVFGPYPFEEYGVIVHDTPLNFALETQTLSVFGNSFTNEFVIAHELSHQWFGGSVSLTQWQDMWLNEGFASYATVLWTEHTSGEEAAAEELEELYANIAPGEPALWINTRDIKNFLARVINDDDLVSPESAGEALENIFGNQITKEQLKEIISGLPEEGLPKDEFPELLEKVGLDLFLLTISGLNRALVFLDLPNEQINASEKYPPPGSPDADTIFSNSVYERGALTLHALRLEVGDAVFFEILQTYTSRYQYSNVTTDDFIAVAEEVSGQDLGNLFQAWLYEEDIPDMPELDLYREDYTIND